jgi:hypothetical protein
MDHHNGLKNGAARDCEHHNSAAADKAKAAKLAKGTAA